LYYFSLPESAAITGLWLGESPDLASRYRFVVSPRGAAQKVYTDQVHRVNPTDPALLEQVGPRNYRLRAFPILPRGQGKMHLWLTYKVLQQDSGWTMPVLHEKRNLFWTSATKRFVNGKRVRAKDQWLPNTLPAKAAEPVAHQMPLSWGGNVLAVPYGQDKLQLPQGKRFALVLDGSYSMNAHQQDVNQTFKWLEQNLLPQNQADLYLTAATPAQPQRLDQIQSFDLKSNSKITAFYGSMEPRTMLSQFLELRQDRAYDAVILITDPGSYELSKDEKAVLNLPAPLWLVHLGGLQLAYDDATLQAIQDSGGGISTTVQEVAYRLGTQPTLGEDTSLINLTDGYAWFLSKTPNASASADEGFYPVNTRQWIAQLGEEVKPGELAQLDTIHALAQEQEIVTPYSSMLVLVNAEQRAALKAAEQQGDRFNRELEDQQLPQPSSSSLHSSVVGVPEPQEWLLLFVTVGLLGVVYRLRQQQETVI
ncbi:MAG: TIGR02921 family PEP-CTERM protein, partial [Microcoleaceae cyanobacterium]